MDWKPTSIRENTNIMNSIAKELWWFLKVAREEPLELRAGNLRRARDYANDGRERLDDPTFVFEGREEIEEKIQALTAELVAAERGGNNPGKQAEPDNISMASIHQALDSGLAPALVIYWVECWKALKPGW